MEKYRLVQEHKAPPEAGGESMFEEQQHHAGGGSSSSAGGGGGGSGPAEGGFPVVRITQQGKPRNYISYAMGLFSDGAQTIVIKAMGRAINKAVTIAEILKRKMPLHQQNSLSSVEMIDVYEPVEEGLDTVESHRYVSCMKITLSLSADDLDVNHPGYQPPLSNDDPLGMGDPSAPSTPTAAASGDYRSSPPASSSGYGPGIATM